jgi:predicted nucleic acid-binding protein
VSGLVPDASFLVAALTDEGTVGRWAEEALAAAGELAAPELLLAETANILRRAEHAGRLASAVAAAAYEDLLALDFVSFPYTPFAERIWELRGNLTTYDAWYVAVAEATGSPLATLDARLARAPGPRCRFALVPARGKAGGGVAGGGVGRA